MVIIVYKYMQWYEYGLEKRRTELMEWIMSLGNTKVCLTILLVCLSNSKIFSMLNIKVIMRLRHLIIGKHV